MSLNFVTKPTNDLLPKFILSPKNAKIGGVCVFAPGLGVMWQDLLGRQLQKCFQTSVLQIHFLCILDIMTLSLISG